MCGVVPQLTCLDDLPVCAADQQPCTGRAPSSPTAHAPLPPPPIPPLLSDDDDHSSAEDPLALVDLIKMRGRRRVEEGAEGGEGLGMATGDDTGEEEGLEEGLGEVYAKVSRPHTGYLVLSVPTA